MKVKLEKYISSYVTTIVLLLIYALGLAIATFIEKYWGTAVAKSVIYYSPLFFLLQLGMVANFLAIVKKHHLIRCKRWSLLVVHFSFIVILLGALVSHIWGEEGILHLREGESSDRIMVRSAEQTTYHTLPFSVELVKFTLTRYPGSASPSAYESELLVHVDGETLHERVYMNNVLDVKGYRFFQASYDPDEAGTVLSVNRDVAGRCISYAGYFLLTVGLLLCFFEKNSRFAYLSRRLKSMGKASLLCLLFASPVWANDKANDMREVMQRYPISKEHAAKFATLPVQSGNGRMLPVNSFSSEVLRKLYKEDTFGQLNSDQFLLSLLAMPDMWIQVPLIALGNNDLADYYNLSRDICSYSEMFDADGQYKLQAKLDEVYGKIATMRTRFDKDLLKLDEQVNILYQLLNRQLLNLFPLEQDAHHKWYAAGDDLSVFSGKDSLFVSHIMDWYLSEVNQALKSGDWAKPNEIVEMIAIYQQAKNTGLDIRPEKMEAEIQYNRLDVFRQCKKGYLILGGLLLLFSFVSFLRRERPIPYVRVLLVMGIVATFAFHVYGMGMRWYIAGYAPWSNSYETMVYVSWATVLAGLLFMHRNAMVLALATLFGGVILFVSGLNWMDPEISPLVPVLKSPWLMFHVAVIVAAYGFFGISCLIGLMNMILISLLGAKNRLTLKLRIEELTLVNEMALWIGLALMTIGTFLGAIWANESWGRYWGWDPKETWALITMVVYAVVLHLRLIPSCKNMWLFNFLSVFSFTSVLMTFFGVNYFLSGMHSYGQNDQVNGIFIYLYASVIIVTLLGVKSCLKYRREIVNKVD